MLDILFLRAEGFSCSLDVIYRGLGISKLQVLIIKQQIFPRCIFFSPVFGHKSPGSGSGIDESIRNTGFRSERLLEINKFERSIEQRIFRKKNVFGSPQFCRHCKGFRKSKIHKGIQSFASRSGFNQVSGSRSGFRIRIRIQEGKNYPQKLKKARKFHAFKYWMLSF